ncbi:MAG: TRAM domain-containing protein [Planctomycetes bacterium]|nr:TRAM domain-containing protein [Planctomycetota bacterium]
MIHPSAGRKKPKFLLIVIRALYALVAAGAIATFVSPAGGGHPIPEVDKHPLAAFFILFGLTQLATVLDIMIRRKRIQVISAIYFGLLVGVLLSYLAVLAIRPVFATLNREHYVGGVGMLITLIVTYLSTSFLLQTKDDFRFVIPYAEFVRELKGGRPLILDTSALIDGRIADVVDTKILDSEILVPSFVLREVQDIADSHEKSRRVRGRRGLDVLSKLQQNPHAEVVVYETDVKNARRETIDQLLIQLAKDVNGRIVTSDFNLNRVATVQGVDVINLNDVANSLKPRFLPGDSVTIKVIKEGESPGQGVGYLDDGTMVVCENAAHLIGREVTCVVTSVLQSSAGRMIFTRLPG